MDRIPTQTAVTKQVRRDFELCFGRPELWWEMWELFFSRLLLSLKLILFLAKTSNLCCLELYDRQLALFLSFLSTVLWFECRLSTKLLLYLSESGLTSKSLASLSFWGSFSYVELLWSDDDWSDWSRFEFLDLPKDLFDSLTRLDNKNQNLIQFKENLTKLFDFR